MIANTFYQQIEAANATLPAVESWDPPLSGDMDCRIARDGNWFIDGARLENTRLARLFSTVLKREDQEYFLVTPVEKWRIRVEDLPFLVVEMEISARATPEQVIRVRTNMGDRVSIDTEHYLDVSPITGSDDRQGIPCVHIRSGLMARFNRTTWLELAGLLEPLADTDQYQVTSAGASFTLLIESNTD